MTGPVPGPRPGPGRPVPSPGTLPGAPRQVTAPTDDSTGDREIDAALAGLVAGDPEDLDGQITAGTALHDVLRARLDAGS